MYRFRTAPVQLRTNRHNNTDGQGPKHPKKDLPYRIFKVELEDMENGDRGEGLYYMEKENYVQ